MDVNIIQRTSSAGYQLLQRAERSDPVNQDRVWRELVWTERRGVKEWERNWGFLRGYDQMGQQKSEKPPATCVSLFSDRMPNTTNQVFGCRLSTPLAIEMIRMDRVLLGQEGLRRQTQDPEMLPC